MATRKQCAFYLQRKGRHCRMQAAKGSVFCGEHLLQGDQGVQVQEGDHVMKRILCPLDHTHSVYEHLLEKHLKKCNAAKKTVPVCYVKNINSGLGFEDESCDDQLSLSDVDKGDIQELVAQVEHVYSGCQEEIEREFLEHTAMADEISSSKNGLSALKHLKQQSSILGHLEKLHLLSSKTCFIEFGAGRGKLSHWLQLAMPAGSTNHYTLIDRASARRKMDLYHRFDDQGPKFERLLIDIEHLDLDRLEALHSGEYSSVVAVSKHLCGAATDLSLRCLMRFHRNCCSTREQETTPSSSSSSSSLPCLSSVLIALCCHQRCSWRSFVGHDFFVKHGFSARDFQLLCHMSSWAVCGLRAGSKVASESTPQEPSASHENTTVPLHTSGEGDKTSGYIPHPKEHIGLKCKRLLDYGRLAYLREQGFSAKLVYYVDRSVSLENVLLLAIPIKPSTTGVR